MKYKMADAEQETFTENFFDIFYLDHTSFSKTDLSREGSLGDFCNVYFTTGSMVQKKDFKKTLGDDFSTQKILSLQESDFFQHKIKFLGIEKYI